MYFAEENQPAVLLDPESAQGATKANIENGKFQMIDRKYWQGAFIKGATMANVTATELISLGLESAGFDGLYIGGICGCKKSDLSPGDCLSQACQAGYVSQHSQDHTKWVIGEHKNLSDEKNRRNY